MQRSRPGWVIAVAVFHFINGSLIAIEGLVTLFAIQGIIDLLEQMGLEAGGLRGITLIPAVVLLAVAVLHIVVGVYLLKLAGWAQIVSVILNTIGLLACVALAIFAFSHDVFSIGITQAIGALVYGLWIYGLINSKSSSAFGQNTCPTCGRKLDPSWEYCPYCQSAEAGPIMPATVPGESGGAGQAGWPTASVPAGMPGQAGGWGPGAPAQPDAWSAQQPIEGPFMPTGPTQVPTFPGTSAPSAGGAGGLGPAPTAAGPGALPPFAPAPVERTQMIQRQPDTLAWLVFQSGPRAGQEVRLHGDGFTIGRNPSQSDLCLEDPTASSMHAKIRLIEGEFILFDLASANGTFLNGEEVQKKTLQDGDRIRLGNTELLFMCVAAPKPKADEAKPEESA